MPYGIPDTTWAGLSPEQQNAAAQAVLSVPEGPLRAAAKNANAAAYFNSGAAAAGYTPDQVGTATNDYFGITNSQVPIGTPDNPFAGGGGGGGGGGAAAPPPYDPYADPSFLNLLNQLDRQASEARTNTQGRTDDVNRNLELTMPRIAEQGRQTRLGVNNNFEARGIARSGQRLETLARARADESGRVGIAQSNAAQQIAELQRGLQTTISDLARQRAEAELQARASHAY